MLERTLVERLDALDLCLTRALKDAIDKSPILKSLPIPRIDTAKFGDAKPLLDCSLVLSAQSRIIAQDDPEEVVH